MWAWIKSLFRKAEVKPVASYKWDQYWSEVLSRLIRANLETFEKASDITLVRKDWKSLDEDQKVQCLVVFFKTLAYYESGYNPESESVDQGKKGYKETYSVGLLQLSGTDQKTMKLSIGYPYSELKDPVKNLTQGIATMVNQINKRGKIIIPYWEKGDPGVYWATLNPGNPNDKTNYITTEVNTLKFDKPKTEVPKPVEKPTSEIPWLEIAKKEIGVTEGFNPKRVIEYHQATSLKAKDVLTAWCSSFANWVMKQAGIKGTNSAWARDWLDWGVPCKPKKGCVMVFERNAPGGDSHVTFWTGEDTASEYLCVGGNQNNRVCIKGYAKKDLLGCRWPKGL